MSTPSAPTNHRARAIERTRQDIVEAAARVFAASGFRAATMQAIAREAGYTAASLYTYFKSKDEIIEALVRDMEQAVVALFDAPVPSGLSFPQRLELLLQRQLSLVAGRSAVLRVALELPCTTDQTEEHAVFLVPLARYLAAGGGADHLRCPPEEAARLLFALARAVVLPWFSGSEQPDVPRTAARLTDLFLNGFGKPPAPAR